jgi:hypothetical protein
MFLRKDVIRRGLDEDACKDVIWKGLRGILNRVRLGWDRGRDGNGTRIFTRTRNGSMDRGTC